MTLPQSLLGTVSMALGWFAAMVLLGFGLRLAAWKPLFDPQRCNLWLASLVSLIFLWSLQAELRAGIELHFLGASVMLLMFGMPLALLGLAVVQAVVLLNTGGDWSAFGINLLCAALLPLLVAHLVWRFVDRYLPANPFVFMFGNGFFGAGLAVAGGGMATAMLLTLSDALPPSLVGDELLPAVLLLAFAEAWLSGMILTLLVVYRPHWVIAFDEQKYFGTRRRPSLNE